MAAKPHDDHAHPGFDVEVEHKDATRATVRFTISPDEFAKTRQLGLKNIARRTRMKGFRPGKTPLHVVEKQYGPQVQQEALQHFLNHAYEIAVQREKLRPAATPRVDLDGVQVEADKPFTHEFEVLLRPEIELGTYKGLKVEGEPLTVGDSEIDEAYAELERQHSRPEPTEEGLEADGMAMCKVVFLHEGEEVFEREGIRLSPKSTPSGIDAAAWEEAMIGAKKDDERELEMVFPEEFPTEAARGKAGTCKVHLTEVLRIVPPTKEEFFKAFEVEDEDGLRAAMKARLVSAKENNERNRIEARLLDMLLEAHPVEVAEQLIKNQADAKVSELKKSLEESGLPEAELQERLDQEYQSASTASERALRAIYIMEEIAKAEEIQVSQDDMKAELESIAERNNAKLDEVRKYYQEEGLFQQLAFELLERKVRNLLRESADIQIQG